MSGVSPDDLHTNLAKWYALTGANVPHWLDTIAATIIGAIIFILLGIILIFGPWIFRRLFPAHLLALKLSLTDFQEIDNKQYFQLHELAAYWVNEKPSLPLSKRAKKQFAIMQEAIESKTLDVIRADLREVLVDASKRVNHGLKPDANPHWRVSRQEALGYANSIGEQPAFLFPKRRIHG